MQSSCSVSIERRTFEQLTLHAGGGVQDNCFVTAHFVRHAFPFREVWEQDEPFNSFAPPASRHFSLFMPLLAIGSLDKEHTRTWLGLGTTFLCSLGRI